jgi:hypothetical protein
LKSVSNFRVVQNTSLALKTPIIVDKTKEFATTLFYERFLFGLGQQFDIKLKLLKNSS